MRRKSLGRGSLPQNGVVGCPFTAVYQTGKRCGRCPGSQLGKHRTRTPFRDRAWHDRWSSRHGISTEQQKYDRDRINEIRRHVDTWRSWKNPNGWQVTPETVRLLQHWRHHKFSDVRPFFCQVEAAETAIWLTEVAPHSKSGKALLDHLASASKDANPELLRLALKLATGAGKTTVMAMLIAWQAVNAARYRSSKHFTRGFLICAPGLTIKDRLRVLQPNDPDSYYEKRELVPSDMLQAVKEAKIVITNYHAFKLRERIELSAGGRSLLQGRTGADTRTRLRKALPPRDPAGRSWVRFRFPAQAPARRRARVTIDAPKSKAGDENGACPCEAKNRPKARRRPPPPRTLKLKISTRWQTSTPARRAYQ